MGRGEIAIPDLKEKRYKSGKAKGEPPAGEVGKAAQRVGTS
jgi:hypothetical protein